MSRPFPLLLTVLTLLPMGGLVAAAPASAQDALPDPESLTLPLPRAGDVVTVTDTFTVNDSTGPDYAVTTRLTSTWSAPTLVRDGYGAAHEAYLVDVESSCQSACGRRSDAVDLATGASFLTRGDLGNPLRLGGGFSIAVGFPVYQPALGWNTKAPPDVTMYDGGPTWAAFAGIPLVPGQRVQAAGPPTPLSPDGYAAAFDVVGWETIEGQRLLRLRPVGSQSATSIWLDAEHHTPARVEGRFVVAYEGFVFRVHVVSVRTGVLPGDGPLLQPREGYAPPNATSYADAPRALYTAEGPSEPILQSLRLQSAVATAKKVPLLQAFLDAHPGAYLYEAAFRETLHDGDADRDAFLKALGLRGGESSTPASVVWSLTWAEDGGRAWATVHVKAPFVPGAAAPVSWSTFASNGTARLPFPPASAVVGRAFACAAHAEAAARAAPGAPDEALVLREGILFAIGPAHALGAEGLACTVAIRGVTPGVAADPGASSLDPRHILLDAPRERHASAAALVLGHSGGVALTQAGPMDDGFYLQLTPSLGHPYDE